MWRDKALCKGRSDIFYHDVGGKTITNIKEAKEICARCPVFKDCLEFIHKTQDHHGIWAGMTPKERRAKGIWAVYDRFTPIN